ncbi:MAG: S46 family peptidase [Bacteroidales bacterium]|nr:S46 family peptidase [Bacteroidales bacterium]
MKRILCSIAAAMLIATSAMADEGMWLLPLIQKLNAGAMKDLGCRLTPEQIYSVNHSSLKDAIVIFGGGCTGEMISDQGLLVTNHHCGYSTIQALSSDEHNYLEDGYWAMSREQELPAPGLSVTYLVSMTDVTDAVAKAEDQNATMQALQKAAQENNPNCRVSVTSFYNENVWYLIVYKTYTDVRFVGAPPASIGKFGGETDNWMWPRHTGDFSMFRVYAGADNEPAAYSPSNKPYVPTQSLKVSLKGVQQGDYAMIMGYPGSTQRFQTEAQLKAMLDRQAVSIDARTLRQDIMWKWMETDPSIRLKYANKYAGSANGWKKWQGERLAFKNLGIIEKEQQKEADFMKWVGKNKKRQAKYGDALEKIKNGVEANTTALDMQLIGETVANIELMGFSSGIQNTLARGLRDGMDSTAALEAAIVAQAKRYQDYYEPLDREEAAALLKYYREKSKPEYYLDGLGDFKNLDIDSYVNNLYDNSIFTSPEKLRAAVAEKGFKAVQDDPVNQLMNSLLMTYVKMGMGGGMGGRRPAGGNTGADDIREGSKAFTAGLLEWQKGKATYPDANFTMRLTYGSVLPYSPKDALMYNYFTTLKGVMEKEDPDNYEFKVPAKLKDLYNAKDYGQYAMADGNLPVCFLTNNDITGGNSGSPVLNADGELIGLAFDGNWESMSSDVMFEPDLQRCICVDIRYVLFLMDKFGGAGYLLKEMNLVK